jgi:hypothetical protein
LALFNGQRESLKEGYEVYVENGYTSSKFNSVNTLYIGKYAKMTVLYMGEKAGLERRLLLEVLAVLTPGQKSKLENVKQKEYPINFALSLMHKDFSLVLSRDYDLSVSMPATTAAHQMQTVENIYDNSPLVKTLDRILQCIFPYSILTLLQPCN